MPLFLLLAGAAVALALCAVDLKERRLPTPAVTVLAVLGLLFRVTVEGDASLAQAIGGAVLGGGIMWGLRELFWRLRGVDAVGMGDVRLAGALGLWVGVAGVGPMLAGGSVLAMVLWPFLQRSDGDGMGFPFGVALVAAATAVMAAFRIGWRFV